VVALLHAVVAVRADEPATASAPSSTEHLVSDLRSRIVRSDSATAVLEQWCGEKGLAGEARLVALRDKTGDKPLTSEQRDRLGLSPDEPVRYRRVRLACGDRVLSEADNWYVPSRLTPEMNAALDGTDTPFGKVVRPLAPTRRVVSVETLPLPAAPTTETPLVRVDAVLVTGAGAPFCEVVETYLGATLPGAER
jgi:chorismate-pyruvate lyase